MKLRRWKRGFSAHTNGLPFAVQSRRDQFQQFV